MIKLVVLLVIAVLSAPAWAQTVTPWGVGGQTRIPANLWTWNPQPNNTGAIGEVTALPYEVPLGCELTVNAYGIEGVPSPGSSGIYLFTGDWPNPADSVNELNKRATVTVTAQDNFSEHLFNETHGVRFIWPDGTIVNVAVVINGSLHNYRWGWYVAGELTCNNP